LENQKSVSPEKTIEELHPSDEYGATCDARTLVINAIQRQSFDRSLIVAYTHKQIYTYMTRNSMSETETTRLTITWSKEADHALRSFLGTQGMKKGDISRFIEEAVRWRIFHQTVREAREAFADVSPDELQKMIDEAVEDVRAKHYRERARRS
jgi:Ribbon-helix-helix domain